MRTQPCRSFIMSKDDGLTHQSYGRAARHIIPSFDLVYLEVKIPEQHSATLLLS
ncbi:hypothetical protein [Photorhabdus cinerea]|uniref:hypothetical protein n=1 Tax=Photorhabdus cinerea TaxID=471575 RepID=UPI00140A2991|nr:hypothetical protein [Photorhabdus cinerea]